MIKISHESPLCLLEQSRQYNDYDYALVHLFEDHEQYYNFFTNSLKRNREIILDNSIFELGTSFDFDKFAEWVNILKPTQYIIPDTFNDYEKTIEQTSEWNKRFKYLPGIKIGVVHGKNYNEIVECYKFMKHNVDKIAFNYADDFYQNFINLSNLNKYEKIAFGRIALIDLLEFNNIIDINMPHHMLGVALPQEVKIYKKHKWIESIDTSNPIVHAIKGVIYNEEGLNYKENIKLADLLNISKDQINEKLLYYNINKFKQFAI